MALPSNGPLSFSDINTELGLSSSATLTATTVLDTAISSSHVNTSFGRFDHRDFIVKFKNKYYALDISTGILRVSADLVVWSDLSVLRDFYDGHKSSKIVANSNFITILRDSSVAPIVTSIDGNTWVASDPIGPGIFYDNIASGPNTTAILCRSSNYYKICHGVLSGGTVTWTLSTYLVYSGPAAGRLLLSKHGFAFNDTMYSVSLGGYNATYLDGFSDIVHGTISSAGIVKVTYANMSLSHIGAVRIYNLLAPAYFTMFISYGLSGTVTSELCVYDASNVSNYWLVKFSSTAMYISMSPPYTYGDQTIVTLDTGSATGYYVANLTNPSSVVNVSSYTGVSQYPRVVHSTGDTMFVRFNRANIGNEYYVVDNEYFEPAFLKSSRMTIINSMRLGSLYGRSNTLFLTHSTTSNKLDLRTWALANGWDGTISLNITNSGNIVSDSTATPALTVTGSFPNGVTLTNTGSITGKGGNGGNGGGGGATFFDQYISPTAGSAGGTALSVSVPCSINNTGTIQGGGGGGGGGRYANFYYSGYYYAIGGGGGGGGASYTAYNSTGGSGGAGSPGYPTANASYGTGSTSSTPGNGGAPGSYGTYRGSAGGNGGAYGTAGSAGSPNNITHSVFLESAAGAGGSGGNAVQGNTNVTWTATGTRLGAIT